MKLTTDAYIRSYESIGAYLRRRLKRMARELIAQDEYPNMGKEERLQIAFMEIQREAARLYRRGMLRRIAKTGGAK